MKSKNVLYFSPREEEIVDLCTRIGIRANIAKVFVYLMNTTEATSRDIERGTDLRQPEVSIAMSIMIGQNWVESRDNKTDSKGRPEKIYKLTLPVGDLIDIVEKEKKVEAAHQLKMVDELRKYVSENQAVPVQVAKIKTN